MPYFLCVKYVPTACIKEARYYRNILQLNHLQKIVLIVGQTLIKPTHESQNSSVHLHLFLYKPSPSVLERLFTHFGGEIISDVKVNIASVRQILLSSC